MSNVDWYARKMRETTPTASSTPAAPLAPIPVRVPPPVTSRPSEIQTSVSTPCPSCGGGNFGRVTPQTAPRCFNCGYVEGRDYQQETFSPSSTNTTQATKQIPTQQYAPGQIIGRIGE